jgi:ribonuclease G
MSKEIYISSTPHETRLAIVEKDELTEIYYERENEYTLAGSIYNGRVTRVLPGMQSSFVDIGLERDAFLYITDFMEEAGDSADFETSHGGASAPRGNGERRERGDRDRGRGRRDERPRSAQGEAAAIAAPLEGDVLPAAPRADAAEDAGADARMASRGRTHRSPTRPQPNSSTRCLRSLRSPRLRRLSRKRPWSVWSLPAKARSAAEDGSMPSASGLRRVRCGVTVRNRGRSTWKRQHRYPRHLYSSH